MTSEVARISASAPSVTAFPHPPPLVFPPPPTEGQSTIEGRGKRDEVADQDTGEAMAQERGEDGGGGGGMECEPLAHVAAAPQRSAIILPQCQIVRDRPDACICVLVLAGNSLRGAGRSAPPT